MADNLTIEDISAEIEETEDSQLPLLTSDQIATNNHRAELQKFSLDLKLRKTYSGRLFNLIIGWLVCVGVLILLQGFDFVPFSLSEKVLITLIGGTTVNVLGLFAIVANYIFPKNSTASTSIKPKSPKSKKKEVTTT